MLRSCHLAALALLLLFATGCDSASPDGNSPEPFFEATLLGGQGPISSVKGMAQLSHGTPDEGFFFSFPANGIADGKQATAVHLTASEGETERTVISLVHIGDDRPAPGEEFAIEASVRSFTFGDGSSGQEGGAPDDVPGWPDELTTAAYHQVTSDSLFAYLPGGGALQIERASDDEMTGTFTIEIAALRAIPLNERPPGGGGFVSDPDDLPGRFEFFTDPLVLRGSFTAVAAEER